MDNSFRIRVQLSGLEGETKDGHLNIREGMKPQQTVSLREERKKTQNWFQRQFAGQMSGVEDESDGEFETAIAAAAYAITLQEEESSPNQQKSIEELGSPLTKTKSIKEESMDKPTDYSKISRWFNGKEATYGKSSVSGDSSLRKSATLEQQQLEDSAADHKPREKEMPTTTKPTASFSRNGNAKGKRTDSTLIETKPDDSWEKEKMDKIKKRYEKMNATVLEWENEKKKKAKLRLERKEKELERRWGRAIQEHRSEIAKIEAIAGRERALAEERKRNDEYKTIEKAKKMRSTGKVPHVWPCL